MNKEKAFFIFLIMILLFLGVTAIFKQNPKLKKELKNMTYSMTKENYFKKIKDIHIKEENYYNHADIQMMIYQSKSNIIVLNKDAYLNKSLYIPKEFKIISKNNSKIYINNVSIAFTHKGLSLENVTIYFQKSFFFANGNNLTIKNSRIFLEGDSNFHIKGDNLILDKSEIYARGLGEKAFSSLLDFKGDNALINGCSFYDLESTYPYALQLRGSGIDFKNNLVKAELRGMRALLNLANVKKINIDNNIFIDYNNKERRRYFEFGKDEKSRVKFSGSIGVMLFEGAELATESNNYFFTDIALFESNPSKNYILDEKLKNKYDLKPIYFKEKLEWSKNSSIDCNALNKFDFKLDHHCF